MVKAFKSNLCSEELNSPYKLNAHIECQHEGVSDRKKKNFKCNVCGHRFSNRNHIMEHTRTHTGERPFKCTFDDYPGCGQKFGNAKSLSQHKRTVHVKKSHACPKPECSYSTKRSNDLVRHMTVHKERNEKIPCSIEGCEYKGKHKRVLEMHMRLHKTLLPCPVSGCGRYIRSKEALNAHVKLHNPLGRPFQCPLCFKHFGTLNQLRKHCVVHTNEKPLVCGHCEYGASFRTSVKKHISRSHADVEFPFIVHLPDDRECLHCRVTMPTAEFVVHCMSHGVRL